MTKPICGQCQRLEAEIERLRELPRLQKSLEREAEIKRLRTEVQRLRTKLWLITHHPDDTSYKEGYQC